MKCEEFTQKKYLSISNELFKEAVKNRDIKALEELSSTTRVLRDMNFIRLNIAYIITYNVYIAKELIKQKNAKVDYKDIVDLIAKENENDKQ